MNGLKKFFNNIDEIVCGTALVLMILLVIINVFLRYLFNFTISWGEEVATICFVWCVFLGASATYKNKMDMGIDYFVARAPEHVKYLFKALTGLLLLAINGYIFVMAIIFTRIAWQKPTAVLGISSSVVNSALIVGFGLITFYTLRFIYRDVQMHRNIAQRHERNS
ncbi:MAG: TRAP transporter small permease [Pseudomonadota bacterium]